MCTISLYLSLFAPSLLHAHTGTHKHAEQDGAVWRGGEPRDASQKTTCRVEVRAGRQTKGRKKKRAWRAQPCRAPVPVKQIPVRCLTEGRERERGKVGGEEEVQTHFLEHTHVCIADITLTRYFAFPCTLPTFLSSSELGAAYSLARLLHAHAHKNPSSRKVPADLLSRLGFLFFFALFPPSHCFLSFNHMQSWKGGKTGKKP